MNLSKYKDKWRVQVYKNGIRKSAIFATKTEAKDWGQRTEIDLASAKPGSDKTLRQACDHYLKSVSSQKNDAVEWERRRFEHFIEHFGDVPIQEITSGLIGLWRDKRLVGDEDHKPVSGSTVLREVSLFRNMFKLAHKEWRWIDESPFDGVRLPKENAPRHQIWTWQLIKRVLRAERIGKTKEMQDAFHIALRSGMRLGEVLAAPTAFDPVRRVVTIKTKTEARAQIPIGRIAAKLLKRPAFVVGANEGSVLFSKLCRELLIEDLTFHDARGTALTHLSKKVDVLTLAKISRHKDLSLLSNVYYRATAESIAAKI